MTGEHAAPPVPVQRTVPGDRSGPTDAAPALDRLADLARRLLGTAHAEVHLPTAGRASRSTAHDRAVDAVCALVPGDAPLVVA